MKKFSDGDVLKQLGTNGIVHFTVVRSESSAIIEGDVVFGYTFSDSLGRLLFVPYVYAHNAFVLAWQKGEEKASGQEWDDKVKQASEEDLSQKRSAPRET